MSWSYDEIASEFDAVMNPYDLQRRIEVVFDELAPPGALEGRRVLDAGCGTGHFSAAARDRGAQVVSLDLGFELLKVTRHRAGGRQVQGDALRLPFADASFPVVISSEMVEHTPDPARAVRELVRVTEPGGLLVVTTPNWTWKWSVIVANALGLRPYHGLENWMGYHELPAALAGAGAEVEVQRGFHFWPFQFPVVRALLRPADRLGGVLGVLAINQGVRARKASA